MLFEIENMPEYQHNPLGRLDYEEDDEEDY